MKKIKILNNLKLTVAFAFLLFVLFACSSVENRIPEKLRNFADDITSNPQKLRNLKDNYPELYNPYCMARYLYISDEIDELVNYISLDYNNLKEDPVYWVNSTDKYFVDLAKERAKCNCGIDSSNLYIFNLSKTGYGIKFWFVKCDSNYKIFYIHEIMKISM